MRRIVLVLGLVLGLVAPARADPEAVHIDAATALAARAEAPHGPASASPVLSHTRAVVAKHARHARGGRIAGGVAMLAIGAALVPFGVYVHGRVEPSGLIDLSPLEYGLAYTMIGAGGISLLAGAVLLARETPQERMASELAYAESLGQADAGAALVRRKIARSARDAERTRRGIRTAGLTLAAAGAASILVIGLTPISLDSSPGLALGFGSVGAVVLGGSLFGAGLVQTPLEDMRDELMKPGLSWSAGVVPTRGGALLGFSARF